MTSPPQDALVARIREVSRPRAPVPTGLDPALRPMPGIRAVLFDVYGTLLLSGVGDVSAEEVARTHERAALAAIAAAGVRLERGISGRAVLDRLAAAIAAGHAARRSAGVDFPEIDIRTMWRDALRSLEVRPAAMGDASVEHLAVEFECARNPVWPMPGAAETLAALSGRGLLLGALSNAQFYTPLVLHALLGGGPVGPGLDPALCVWSFEHGVAKPSLRLVDIALRRLGSRHGLRPSEVLVVGNDPRLDVDPARERGCATALLAADRDSCRPAGAGAPDLLLTDLAQLPAVV